MPQEVLEPPCVHSPGRQCISGRIPQHMLVMDRERQAMALACRLNHASNAHPTERLATLIDEIRGRNFRNGVSRRDAKLGNPWMPRAPAGSGVSRQD